MQSYFQRIVRIEKVGDWFVLPQEAVEELRLQEGTVIEVTRADTDPSHRYASVEETMRVFESTLKTHDAVYRELAKGPVGLGPHDPLPFDRNKW
jgi:hypothetical protein